MEDNSYQSMTWWSWLYADTYNNGYINDTSAQKKNHGASADKALFKLYLHFEGSGHSMQKKKEKKSVQLRLSLKTLVKKPDDEIRGVDTHALFTHRNPPKLSFCTQIVFEPWVPTLDTFPYMPTQTFQNRLFFFITSVC